MNPPLTQMERLRIQRLHERSVAIIANAEGERNVMRFRDAIRRASDCDQQIKAIWRDATARAIRKGAAA